MSGKLVYSSNYPHRPPHRFSEKGTYIVTCGTFHKEHFFNNDELLTHLTTTLLDFATEYQWTLQAWAVMSNHYHFVAESESPSNLPNFIRRLHAVTALKANRFDNTQGRKVWWNYWESEIESHDDWLARVHYVNQNPVKHGVVAHAVNYPYCSASWLEMKASREFIKTLDCFDIGEIDVMDDY